MNNTIFPARKPGPLVRMWRSTGELGTPLVCNWVTIEAGKPLSDSVTDEIGGRLRCA